MPYAPDHSYSWKPADSGLLLATADPVLCSTQLQPSAGPIFLAKVWVPVSTTVANLLMYVQTAGATLTAGQNLAGIYNPAGTLVAQTADQSSGTAWNTIGWKTMALTAQGGQTITPLAGGAGVWYWAAYLVNGTTTPKFACTPSGVGAGINIGNGYPYAAAVPGASHRFGYTAVGGRTSLISLNTLSITDNFQGAIPFVGVT
jgi:hypothetical protein